MIRFSVPIRLLMKQVNLKMRYFAFDAACKRLKLLKRTQRSKSTTFASKVLASGSIKYQKMGIRGGTRLIVHTMEPYLGLQESCPLTEWSFNHPITFNHLPFFSKCPSEPTVKHETLAKLSEPLRGSYHRDVGWGSTFKYNFSRSWKKKKRRAVTMMDSPRRGEKDGRRGRTRGKDWGRYEKKAKANIKRRTEEEKSHKGE